MRGDCVISCRKILAGNGRSVYHVENQIDLFGSLAMRISCFFAVLWLFMVLVIAMPQESAAQSKQRDHAQDRFNAELARERGYHVNRNTARRSVRRVRGVRSHRRQTRRLRTHRRVVRRGKFYARPYHYRKRYSQVFAPFYTSYFSSNIFRPNGFYVRHR